jgi:hypothetical protein
VVTFSKFDELETKWNALNLGLSLYLPYKHIFHSLQEEERTKRQKGDMKKNVSDNATTWEALPLDKTKQKPVKPELLGFVW